MSLLQLKFKQIGLDIYNDGIRRDNYFTELNYLLDYQTDLDIYSISQISYMILPVSLLKSSFSCN